MSEGNHHCMPSDAVEVGMVRRREEEGPRRAAAIEGEENHYCQLR